VEEGLIAEYGKVNWEKKKKDFIALEAKSFAIIAFHNRFLCQIRNAFVMGAYYPALTGACSLGERILNHLILNLRDDFKERSEYRNVYKKDSFDNWDVPINTLNSWDVLLPDVAKEFVLLKDMRHKAIHFRPEVDSNDRQLALDAIQCLQKIIGNQFSSFGQQPWFIANDLGESYIKKDWALRPFIRKIYLPNCFLLGPKHFIKTLSPLEVRECREYEDREISDEEFVSLRIANRDFFAPRSPIAGHPYT